MEKEAFLRSIERKSPAGSETFSPTSGNSENFTKKYQKRETTERLHTKIQGKQRRKFKVIQKNAQLDKRKPSLRSRSSRRSCSPRSTFSSGNFQQAYTSFKYTKIIMLRGRGKKVGKSKGKKGGKATSSNNSDGSEKAGPSSFPKENPALPIEAPPPLLPIQDQKIPGGEMTLSVGLTGHPVISGSVGNPRTQGLGKLCDEEEKLSIENVAENEFIKKEVKTPTLPIENGQEKAETAVAPMSPNAIVLNKNDRENDEVAVFYWEKQSDEP